MSSQNDFFNDSSVKCSGCFLAWHSGLEPVKPALPSLGSWMTLDSLQAWWQTISSRLRWINSIWQKGVAIESATIQCQEICHLLIVNNNFATSPKLSFQNLNLQWFSFILLFYAWIWLLTVSFWHFLTKFANEVIINFIGNIKLFCDK